MNKVFASLSALALAVTLASPLAAQSIMVKASVPFDFTVGPSALPAGDYAVSAQSSTGLVSVRSESGAGAVFVLALSHTDRDVGARSQVLLVFHRYSDQYFLSQIWDGSRTTGRTIPMSRSEREVSSRASIRQPESVMILARL